jgi:probable HAF family extracellular repeat protein
VVTGQSDISNDPDPVFGIAPFHGILWSAGTLTDLGSIFGSSFNYGNGINDAGIVTGSADLAGDTGAHAFLWSQGMVQDLTPYGDLTAWGIDINNQGQVIGSWGSVDPDPADGPPVDTMECPCYAVLWQNGGAVFLNDVVPSQWNLWLGLAINDRGEILARGQFNGGKLETVLLKPIPVAEQRGMPDLAAPKERNPGAGPRALHRDRQGRIAEIQ